MDTTKKISIIKSQIIAMKTQQLKDFERKLEMLIAKCESEIEKFFLLNLCNFYQENFPLTGGFKFIERPLTEEEIEVNSLDAFVVKAYPNGVYHAALLKSEYLHGGPELFIIEGVKFQNGNELRFELYPQKWIKSYRADFELIVKNIHNEILGKFCIECDGFAHHSSKEQLEKDNTRSRFLLENQYRMIRYTGSEIYKMSSKKILQDFEKTVTKAITGKESDLFIYLNY